MLDAPPVPDRDDEQIRLLSIFHYVLAGITLLLSFCPSLHLAIGLTMLISPELVEDQQTGEAVPRVFAWMFTLLPLAMMMCGWVLTGLLVYAGRCLGRRVRRTFCLVVAGISCVFMPLGTVLGVFTIIVLMRPTVAAQFDARA